MADELINRIANNLLNDTDKEQLTNLVTPKVPYYKREETKERMRLKYNTDEEYRQKTLKARLEYYYRKTADQEKKEEGKRYMKTMKKNAESQTKT
jgi:hypothetical protein